MGGLETHLEDLTKIIYKKGLSSFVLTYKPVTTKIPAKIYEKHDGIEIFRISWFGNLFYKLVKNPILEFLYLTPALMFVLPVLLIIRKDICVIHSHGLIAGFPAVFWGKIFGKKVITTTHSIYNFPNHGLYHDFSAWIYNNADAVLVLSDQSRREILDLGIDKNKVIRFTYWIDLKHFSKVPGAKKHLGWEKKFVVLSAGRLVPEKGLLELLDAAKKWNSKITLAIAGAGPLENTIRDHTRKYKNIIYLGNIDSTKMPIYYSAADFLIVPSVHEEGFGRIVLESLACGTPVIGSNRGAIPEAMDKSVGKLIDISPSNIKQAVEELYVNKGKLLGLASNCRKFAVSRYAESNAKTMIDLYLK